MAELTYLQAISDGLRLEMRRDKRVYVIGEDVGVYGGAFKVTLGFQEEFGPWRVIDAPLSETAIVGSCTGAALMGMRPVAEMQFADFVSCAWDQLVTIAAKQFYRAGTPVPIVEARTHREGGDISVITWGAMVYTAGEAADELAKEDVSVEIVDLRSVLPWDREAVLASVRKTSKVLVLHEDTRTGGFGAEIAATIG